MRGPLWVIDLRCYRDQACLVQLASETRGILLGALALKDVMKELSQPSWIDSLIARSAMAMCATSRASVTMMA